MTVTNDDKVQDTDIENPGQDPNNPPASQDDGGGAGGNGKDDLVAKAELEKQIQQRRKANKEAQEAKRRAEALEAKVREYEDKDKSELEKLQAEREELAKRAEAAERKAQETERRSAVLLAGAKRGSATRFIASELATAESEDAELDRDKWLADFRKENPEFFQSEKPAPKTAEGGPGESGKLSREAQMVKDVEAQIENTRDPEERFYLKRRLRQLKKEAQA